MKKNHSLDHSLVMTGTNNRHFNVICAYSDDSYQCNTKKVQSLQPQLQFKKRKEFFYW